MSYRVFYSYFLRLCKLSVLLLSLGLFIQQLQAEKESKKVDKVDVSTEKKSEVPKLDNLEIKDLLGLLLSRNNDLRIQQLELLKSDTEQKKKDSIYAPVLEAGGSWNRQKIRYISPFTPSDTKESYDFYLRAKKQFITGTYFETQMHNKLMPDQIIGGPAEGTTGSQYLVSSIHKSGLSVVLGQELLKNAFGYNYRRQNQIFRNNSEIKKEELIYFVARLVVEAMIGFWQVFIEQENIVSMQNYLKNTQKLRSVTVRKTRLGLAERFEIKQWDAFVAVARSRLEQVSMQRDSTWRNLLRSVNMDAKTTAVPERVKLNTEKVTDLNAEKDLELAYRTRPDFRSIQLQKQNANTAFQIAKNQLLPSLNLNLKYTGQGFDTRIGESLRQAAAASYPDFNIGLNLTYPLWDKKIRVEARNAKINLRQLEIREKELRQQIRDEIRQGIQQIEVSYKSMLNAKRAYSATRSFYRGLVGGYRRGRFTANAVKNAQDMLVETRQNHMQAIINYNINIVRYDSTRNIVFQKYGIDVDQIIERIYAQLKKM